MPIFPSLDAQQAQQFNNFLLARRGPTFPMVQSPQFATLQNPRLPAAMVRDEFEEAEASRAGMAPLMDSAMSDTELVKSQWGRGGSTVGELMEGAPRPSSSGGIDYSGVKPIRGGSESLLSNPKFLHLARTDPARAAKAYQAITGRDMGNDFQQKQALDLTRQKDISDTIRGQVMRGDLRQHPETGFIERRVSIPDPNNPTQRVDAWETMDTEAQLAMSQNWETALGAKMARANPIAALPLPAAQKSLVMASYIKNVKAGMAPRDAMTEAIKSVPVGTQDATAPSTAAAATPHTSKASPPPSDPAEFQKWMTQNVQSRNAAIGDAALAGAGQVASTAVGAIDRGSGMLESGGEVLANTIGVSVPNLLNQAYMGITGKPAWNWMRPARNEPPPPAYKMPNYQIDDEYMTPDGYYLKR